MDFPSVDTRPLAGWYVEYFDVMEMKQRQFFSVYQMNLLIDFIVELDTRMIRLERGESG